MPKSILQEYQSSSKQKTAQKNTKYSRNETILAIGSFAKPRAHAEAIVHKMVSLGHKIKNTEKIAKWYLKKNNRVVLRKKQLEKTPNIREMRQFRISVFCTGLSSCKRLQPLKNGRSGSKIQNKERMPKTILQQHQTCSAEKTNQKNTKSSKTDTILKIGHVAKAIAFAKWSAWVKN